jgi:hypothetical protein
MAKRRLSQKASGRKVSGGRLSRTPAQKLPRNAVKAEVNRGTYRFTYTTGPFGLPIKTHSIDWGLLNNDTTVQRARITVFKCHLGAVKAAEPPGPLEVTLRPGETTHNANAATGGFFYEIQVECNSQLLFPYASAWPGSIGDPMPGSVVKSAEFIRKLG